MKDKIILIAFLVIVMTITPLFFTQGEDKPQGEMEEKENPIKSETDIKFDVYNCDTEEIMTLDGKEYIIGVLAGEMPASFESEALKAQAVAAFTYAYRRWTLKDNEAHEGVSLCTDSSHCKAFSDKDEMKERWGEDYEEYYSKISSAVNEVYGIIMTYEGETVDAVFHAISSGKTEAAKDVWGNDVPYLSAVESFADTYVDGYLTKTTVTKAEFKKIMREFNEEVEFDVDKNRWLLNTVRSDSGGIISAELCGLPVSGRTVRKLFGLRSSNFELDYDDGIFTFTVKGFGHGVGMSQHGANALAKEGYSYNDILKHYYSGVTLERVAFQ